MRLRECPITGILWQLFCSLIPVMEHLRWSHVSYGRFTGFKITRRVTPWIELHSVQLLMLIVSVWMSNFSSVTDFLAFPMSCWKSLAYINLLWYCFEWLCLGFGAQNRVRSFKVVYQAFFVPTSFSSCCFAQRMTKHTASCSLEKRLLFVSGTVVLSYWRLH